MGIFSEAVLDPLAWWLSKNELNRLMNTEDLDQIIKTTYTYKGRGRYYSIKAQQRFYEIKELALLVKKAKPKVIVEIGSYKGGTLYIWTRSNPSVELVVSIDLPNGDFGGGYDQRREKLYRHFLNGKNNVRMELIRGNSHEINTFEKLKSILNGRKIDFMYIDGDHTYNGVKADFEMYKGLIKTGGMMGFHDIVNRNSKHEVHKFWGEAKQVYQTKEFLDPDGALTGNGVIFL